MATKTIYFSNPRHLSLLYAGQAQNLAHAESALSVKLTTREEWLKVDGEADAIQRVETLFG